MIAFWPRLGNFVFWASLPILHIYLRFSNRTRILLVSGDQVLVVKPWLGSGRWTLPGGGLRWGEDPLQGVLRELHEETHITILPQPPILLFRGRYCQDGLRFNYHCYVMPLPNTLRFKKRIWELIDAAWMYKDQLTSTNAAQDVCQAIEQYFKG